MDPSLPPGGQPSRSRYECGTIPVFCLLGGEESESRALALIYSFSLTCFLSHSPSRSDPQQVPAEGAGLLNHSTDTLPLDPGTAALLSPDTVVKILPHLSPARGGEVMLGDVGPRSLPASLSVTAVFLYKLGSDPDKPLSVKDLTRKTIFLVAVTSAKRVSQIWFEGAFSNFFPDSAVLIPMLGSIK